MEIKNEVCKAQIAIASKLNRIPRPPNAFMLFANNNRKKLAAQFPHDSNKEISCRLGQQWKILEPHLKEHYFEMAKSIDMEHKRKYPDYVYNPKEARLRKALRENSSMKKSPSMSQKSGNKKSGNDTSNQNDGQNAANKSFPFLQPGNSYVQILPHNSWMPMNNMQQPQIWIQYHPTNVTVPKALVLVPPRVVNFGQQNSPGVSTFPNTTTFCDAPTQVIKDTSGRRAEDSLEINASNKGQQIPCSLYNMNDMTSKTSLLANCLNMQQQKPEQLHNVVQFPVSSNGCFVGKPTQVMYANPVNMDCNTFYQQGPRTSTTNAISFNEEFGSDVFTLVPTDSCSKYVCVNSPQLQTNSVSNMNTQLLNVVTEKASMENMQALDLSKVSGNTSSAEERQIERGVNNQDQYTSQEMCLKECD